MVRITHLIILVALTETLVHAKVGLKIFKILSKLKKPKILQRGSGDDLYTNRLPPYSPDLISKYPPVTPPNAYPDIPQENPIPDAPNFPPPLTPSQYPSIPYTFNIPPPPDYPAPPPPNYPAPPPPNHQVPALPDLPPDELPNFIPPAPRGHILVSVNNGSITYKTSTYDVIQTTPLDQSMSHFSIDLLHALAHKSPQEFHNLLFSPFSVYKALLKLILISDENTRRQMERVINLEGIDINTVVEFVENNTESLQRTVLEGQYLYVDENVPLKSDFVDEVSSGTEAGCLDKNYSSITEKIDEIVESFSQGFMKKTSDKCILPDTSAMINALYFKSSWVFPMESRLSAFEEFLTSTGEIIKVNMMHLTEYLGFHYSPQLGVQVVSLPYSDPSYTLMLFLAEEEGIQKVKELISTLTPDSLKGLYENLESRKVDLTLPKVRVSSCLDLTTVLLKMKVTDLFDTSANLCQLTDDPVHLDGFLQTSGIEFNDNGVVKRNPGIVDRTGAVDVTMNRSFLYIVYNKVQHIPMLIGVMTHPNM